MCRGRQRSCVSRRRRRRRSQAAPLERPPRRVVARSCCRAHTSAARSSAPVRCSPARRTSRSGRAASRPPPSSPARRAEGVELARRRPRGALLAYAKSGRRSSRCSRCGCDARRCSPSRSARSSQRRARARTASPTRITRTSSARAARRSGSSRRSSCSGRRRARSAPGRAPGGGGAAAAPPDRVAQRARRAHGPPATKAAVHRRSAARRARRPDAPLLEERDPPVDRRTENREWRIRVGINGFGRIGRNFFRAQHALGADLEIVALNDLGDAETMAHCSGTTRCSGRSPGDVELGDGSDQAAGEEIRCSPSATRLSCRGAISGSTSCSSRRLFTEREGAQKHLDAGAKKVVISAPATDPDVTVVLGVNDGDYDAAPTTSSRTPPARRTASRRSRRSRRPAGSSGLHDDDPRVHERPADPRPAAQGPAPRTRGGDQPDPDLDRGGEGDRARAAGAEGQGRRDVGACARSRRARSPISSSRSAARRRWTRSTTLYRGRGRPGRSPGSSSYSDDPLVSTDIVAAAVLVHLRQPADDGERPHGQGVRLVRQRVGLLVPARRPVGELLARETQRPRSVRDADVAGKRVLVRADLNVPLEDGGSPTTRGSAPRCRRCELCSTAAPPRSPCARTSGGRRGPDPATRWLRSRLGCASSSRRAARRAREHALRSRRDEERPGPRGGWQRGATCT